MYICMYKMKEGAKKVFRFSKKKAFVMQSQSLLHDI